MDKVESKGPDLTSQLEGQHLTDNDAEKRGWTFFNSAKRNQASDKIRLVLRLTRNLLCWVIF